jgi:hypothetical protein
VYLQGDSAIEFASKEITSLAANALLYLDSNDAFIEDSTALGSNSALTGLASIGAGANLFFGNGASVSTTGALANDGNINIDTINSDAGGTILSLVGALTNSGALSIGNSSLSSSSKVSATALTNTGSISLDNSFGANQALLDVTAGNAGFGAAGVLSGNVQLRGDSAIEFASGEISTIAASSELDLSGNSAFIEDSTALGSNSALTGLTDVAGTLYLEFGASVSTTGSVTDIAGSLLFFDDVSLSTTGSVTNSGSLGLDDSNYATGGSTLSIGGTLTNTGMLEIGNGHAMTAPDKVTAASLDNTHEIELIGRGTNLAALNVSGAITNNGSISIASDTEELAGAVSEAVGKTGSFGLSSANLQFDSSVSCGQTINESGADALTLKQAQSFAATISGFGTGDTIDAANFAAPPATTFNFVENSANTGGTLTLTDSSQSLTAKILMTGQYSNSDFTLAPDSGTGTLVEFV